MFQKSVFCFQISAHFINNAEMKPSFIHTSLSGPVIIYVYSTRKSTGEKIWAVSKISIHMRTDLV